MSMLGQEQQQCQHIHCLGGRISYRNYIQRTLTLLSIFAFLTVNGFMSPSSRRALSLSSSSSSTFTSKTGLVVLSMGVSDDQQQHQQQQQQQQQQEDKEKTEQESISQLQDYRDELIHYRNKLDALQKALQESLATTASTTTEIETKTQAIEKIKQEFLDINQKIEQALSSTVLPPDGLSMEEFQAACQTFLELPPQCRLAFIKAVGMDERSVFSDPLKIPEIVKKLYEQRNTLTPQFLMDCRRAAKKGPLLTDDNNNNRLEVGVQQVFSNDQNNFFFTDNKNKNNDNDNTNGNDQELSQEETEIVSNANTFLPRVTRKDSNPVTSEDLQILMDALDNKVFTATAKPIKIPGGYVIRGENRKKTGKELIDTLDEKLPTDWDCTVCWMLDVADVSEDQLFDELSALVLLKKDFSPTISEWLNRLISSISFVTILLFSVGVYGSNQDILNRLTDASALNNFSELDWFNAKVGQVFFPIIAILASHELGHFTIAKKEKIETTSIIPTFVPIFGSLPLLGTLTRIKAAPPNYTALFDFALAGPLLGFISSFGFLISGLIATKVAMDGDSGSAAQLLPALPVSVLDLSTFGGSIIDYFFAGGNGYITGLDPATPITLHPFAIAGYCGLLINAAEMLPLGANDGGRLAMSIFGRRGQSLIGGLTWGALLIASFSLDDSQGPLLIAAWASNNVFQNDMEVPCRDETDNPNLPRLAVAFALWFLSVLIIIPLPQS